MAETQSTQNITLPELVCTWSFNRRLSKWYNRFGRLNFDFGKTFTQVFQAPLKLTMSFTTTR